MQFGDVSLLIINRESEAAGKNPGGFDLTLE
jgi:hypothetical protein